ncbi:Growth arrest/ DNA-damage-inducible protein-interacting protein 1 family-containing protein [Aphelenchoides bicaudatus]|nr:Growth arrest/ DNA-damage-inducible protein-interacting protein 1 family-containing protein [Aphelenchoides bicaudatus]
MLTNLSRHRATAKTVWNSPHVFKSISFASFRGVSNESARPITYEETKEKIKMANRFGTMGLKAGVDIRKLWPTVEEIKEIQELRLHRTAQEAVQIAKEAERKKTERYAKRQSEIDQKMGEYL